MAVLGWLFLTVVAFFTTCAAASALVFSRAVTGECGREGLFMMVLAIALMTTVWFTCPFKLVPV